MKIYVDADACPVTEEVISIARDKDIPVVLVKNYSHYSHGEIPAGMETIYVEPGNDLADFKIVELANKGDIIITQDYGLASLCLGKECIVLHHKGFAYSQNNIDQLLHSRHMSAMARKSGQRTKGPSPFTAEDRLKFSNLLIKTIQFVK